MKRYVSAIVVLALLGIVASAWSQQPRPAQPAQPKAGQPAAPTAPPAKSDPKAKADVPAAAEVKGLASNKQKFSYGLGLRTGSEFQGQLMADDFDMEAFVRGLTDSLQDTKPAVPIQEIRKAMMEYHEQLEAKAQERAKAMAEKMKAVGEKNKKDGPAFLAANKAKEGVKTLPDGLQYKVVKSGTGASPKAGEYATVHYRGTLTDGTVFDSSYDRGEPATFDITRVIKGWTEGLQMMKVGDKWQLFIPAELAYGEEGRPPKIGPNAALVFDVELLDVSKTPPPGEQ